MYMAFFSSAITTLKTLVVAIGAGLGVWGVVNLLEGYGNDNPGAKSQGIKHLMRLKADKKDLKAEKYWKEKIKNMPNFPMLDYQKKFTEGSNSSARWKSRRQV